MAFEWKPGLLSLGIGSLLCVGCATAPKQFQLSLTGAGQALTQVTKEPVMEVWPAISPDGRTLLFTASTTKADESVQSLIVGVDPRTGLRRTIYTSANTLAWQPCWLADGSGIVFCSNTLGAASVVETVSSSPNSALRILVPGTSGQTISSVAVAPDASKIAFVAASQNQYNVVIVGRDGSNLMVLGEGFRPAWSPQGDRIAFVRAVSGYMQIFTVSANDGSDLVQVTSGNANSTSPDWSPDGDLIVFTSDRGSETKPKAWNLYVVRPEGTGLVQLTDGTAEAGSPDWGADGWIYFSSNQAGNHDVWRLKINAAALKGDASST